MRVPSLHALVFKTFYDLLFLFILLFRNSKREERWGGRGEDAWSVKYDNNTELFVHIKLRIIKNSSGFINPNITLLYLQGLGLINHSLHVDYY